MQHKFATLMWSGKSKDWRTFSHNQTRNQEGNQRCIIPPKHKALFFN